MKWLKLFSALLAGSLISTGSFGQSFPEKTVLATEEIKTRMIAQGSDPAFLDGAPFTTFLKAENARWAAADKKANVKLD